jgi:uncharacterized protein YjbI with pentapeptide repeats
LLVGARFNGADLRGADLRGAVLHYTPATFNLGDTGRDFVVQELNAAARAIYKRDAEFSGARYDAATRWPVGLNAPAEATLEQ